MPEGERPPLGRLTRRADFLAVAKGRRFHTDRMTVQGLVRPEGGGSEPASLRVGLTVTKRVGHATERNRIKRRLRAAVAAAGPDHRARPADVVVVARRDCLGAPFPVLVEDLGRALGLVTRPRSPRNGPPGRGSGPGPASTAGGEQAAN